VRPWLQGLIQRFAASVTDVRDIFSRGLSHLCPKNISTAPEKNCCANLQNCLARLTPSNTIGKNPGFQALHIAGRDEFRFFRSMNTIFFHFCLLPLPEKLSVRPKNNVSARLSWTPTIQ